MVRPNSAALCEVDTYPRNCELDSTQGKVSVPARVRRMRRNSAQPACGKKPQQSTLLTPAVHLNVERPAFGLGRLTRLQLRMSWSEVRNAYSGEAHSKGEVGSPEKAASSIRPLIDKTFPFDPTLQALAYVEQGRANGKVLITTLH
jgi:Zinc-binding dehydrogenase